MSQQRIALVTGANRGLGFEICRQLGQQGITVVLGARDSGKGNEAAAKLQGEGIEAHAVMLDVSKSSSIAQARQAIEKQFGRLDILVNNAGIILDWGTDPSALEPAVLRDTFETNVYAVYEVTRAFLPLIRKSNAGRIVNITSDMASLSSLSDPQMPAAAGAVAPAYQMSKAAVNALTLVFAKELRDTNIKVNAAAPGWCRTEMGTDAAPLSVAEGADTPVWCATLPEDGPTGRFFSSTHARGQFPW